MFVVYIIYSKALNKFYTGYTENIDIRLTQHNQGISTFTAKATDWVVQYLKEFETRQQAFYFEQSIKKKKSRKYIEWLVQNYKTN